MSENNNASTMMVALVAILVIIAVGFIVLRFVPGMADTGGSTIDVDVPTPNVNVTE